jgi:hypothetical protein
MPLIGRHCRHKLWPVIECAEHAPLMAGGKLLKTLGEEFTDG